MEEEESFMNEYLDLLSHDSNVIVTGVLRQAILHANHDPDQIDNANPNIVQNANTEFGLPKVDHAAGALGKHQHASSESELFLLNSIEDEDDDDDEDDEDEEEDELNECEDGFNVKLGEKRKANPNAVRNQLDTLSKQQESQQKQSAPQQIGSASKEKPVLLKKSASSSIDINRRYRRRVQDSINELQSHLELRQLCPSNGKLSRSEAANRSLAYIKSLELYTERMRRACEIAFLLQDKQHTKSYLLDTISRFKNDVQRSLREVVMDVLYVFDFALAEIWIQNRSNPSSQTDPKAASAAPARSAAADSVAAQASPSGEGGAGASEAMTKKKDAFSSVGKNGEELRHWCSIRKLCLSGESDSLLKRFENSSEKMTFGSMQGLPGRTLAMKQSQYLPETNDSGQFLRAQQAKEAGIQSGYAFPILRKGKVCFVATFLSAEKREFNYLLFRTVQSLFSEFTALLDQPPAIILNTANPAPTTRPNTSTTPINPAASTSHPIGPSTFARDPTL